MSDFVYNAEDSAIVRYFDYIMYATNNNLEIPEYFTYNNVNYYIKEIFDKFRTFSETEIKEYRRINTNHRRRRDRYFNKIYDLFQSFDCLFITLTFTDDVLESTNKQTRRKYVTRYLKSCSYLYLGNIDYGKENGREHYHAIITKEDKLPPKWEYGYYLVLPCANNKTSIDCLANYVLKLTNHALKKGTRQERIIYPRRKKSQ